MADVTVITSTNTALVEQLRPGREYTAQVSVDAFRDPSGNLISNPWSASLTFQTITDNVAPATPGNFQVELVGETYVITWDKPTLNADGSPLENDFEFYILDFYPPGQPLLTQTYYLLYEETKFELPLPLNRLLFGVPQGSLTFSIRSMDLSGNESVPATETAGGVPPVAPVLDTPSGSSVTTVKLRWTNDQKVNYYTIHRGTSNGLHTDVGWTMVGSASPSNTADEPYLYYYDLPQPGTYWYIVVAHDSFGLSAASNSASGIAENPVTGDPDLTVAPPAATITPGIHSFNVTQDVSLMDPMPRFIEVYASPNNTVGSYERLGTLTVSEDEESPGTFIAEGNFIWVVTGPSESVWIKMRGANNASDSPFSTPIEVTGIQQSTTPTIADAAIIDAKIQNLDASKLMANTAFVNDLDVESVFTLKTGGVMRSSLYTPGVEGWYLDSTGFAELNDLILRGNIEATSGYLSNVNVRNTLTVGDGATAGTIQSSTPLTSGGWRIQSDGSVDFRNGNFRGYIYATSGYLSNLTVGGQLTITSGAGSVVHSAGSFALNANGTASFGSTVTTGGSLNVNGTMSINGTSYLYSTLFVSGNAIQLGTSSWSNIRLESANNGQLIFRNSNNTWTVRPTDQNNLLFTINSSSGQGFAFSNPFGGYQLLRLQGGGATRAWFSVSSSSLDKFNIAAGNWQLRFTDGTTNQLQIRNATGTVLHYVFGATAFTPSTTGKNLGTSVQRWGTVYASAALNTSDAREKTDIATTRFGLDFIKGLRPVEYRLTSGDSGRFHHGFVAQDVNLSLQEYGETSQNFGGVVDPTINPVTEDEIGNPNARWSLNYSQFIAPLVRAVQELAESVDELSARVTSLET